MDLTFSTPLKGNLVLCSDYRDAALHRSPGLYKFVWVRRGCLWLEVDHIPMELRVGMLLPLTPLHTLDVTRAEGEYLILAFDSNFYCIFGHDGEVSCSGLLFNGSSEVLRLELSEMRTAALQRVVDDLRAEYGVVDGLREEMLRMQLKRFIIICTRIAREHFSVGADRENSSTRCAVTMCWSTSISGRRNGCRTMPDCSTGRPRRSPTSSPRAGSPRR